MKKEFKWLLFWFVLILCIKLVGAYFFVGAPSAFSDEYSYMKVARSFYYDQEFTVQGEPFYKYPPLYSITMSLAYWVGDVFVGALGSMKMVYGAMKVINVILSLIIMFPVFLLAREIFSKKGALWFAVLSAFVPGVYVMSSYVLSENLFFPLFMFAFYFTYKSFVRSHEWRWSLLAGLFVGLCLLTRLIVLPFIGAIGLMFLFADYRTPDSNIKQPSRQYELFWNVARIIFVAVLIAAPWFLFGQGISGSHYVHKPIYDSNALLALLTIPFVYLAYLMFASGIVPFFSLFPKKQLNGKRKYFWTLGILTVLSFIIFLGIRQMEAFIYIPTIFPWIGARPIGRYVTCLIPIIVMMGFINYDNNSIKAGKWNWLLVGVSWFAGLFLYYFSLFPVNNSDLTILGGIKVYLTNALMNTFSFNISPIIYPILVMGVVTILFIIIAYFIRDLLSKEVLVLIFTFFFITSHLGVIVSDFNAHYWYDGEAMKFGRWVDNHIPKNSDILIDQQACEGRITKDNQAIVCEAVGELVSTPTTIMGASMNHNIYIGNIKDLNIKKDYIITRQNLTLPLLYESYSHIKIYKYEIN